jgi:hypothetical protein
MMGTFSRDKGLRAERSIARICASDPTCAEHWRNLAGYAWITGCDRPG